ncbi:MAG: PIN domain-containing protein, partial [Nitrosomonadales bacterium]|nr:PIN domain-containing protein [Nitrosomonadales bacterium]
GKKISANRISTQFPDPDDLPFLEVAISAQADFLITGNHVHFPKELC